MKAELKLTAVFEEAEEGGYIAFFEELPGVNTQGETLSEAKINLLEALDLVMDTQRILSERNIGTRNVIKESLVFAS
jgi:predicted RNase H-like HicB family nuclease